MTNQAAASVNISESSSNLGKSLKLKTKATLLAIAIGVIPVLAVGATAYYFANKSITKQLLELKETQTAELQDKVSRFMKEKLGDMKLMADLNVFTNPNATPEQKAATLESIKSAKGIYDSIAVFDLKGEPIAQTKEGKKLGNHLSRTYIQDALKVNGAILSQPTISKTQGTFSIYAASTIKNKATGKPIALIRARLPVAALKEAIQNYETEGQQFYLINEADEAFLGAEEELKMQNAASGETTTNTSGYQAVLSEQIFPDLKSIKSVEEVSSIVTTNQINQTKQLLSYAPPSKLEGLQDLNWKAILVRDAKLAFAAQRQLGLTITVGLGITTLLVAAIATYLANQATKPLIEVVAGVKKIGGGDLDTRLAVTSQDELGELNTNINLMTKQIQGSLEEQKVLVEQQRQEKEKLEIAIFTLLEEVSDATDGDLTVRANLDSMELSTVADLFNAIITSLQDIAIEAKQSTSQVGLSLKQNEEEIRLLAEQAIAETKEAQETLRSVQQMSQSIQAVAENAGQAEKITDDTYNTIVSSTQNMDSTVKSILELRTTVGETAKKMKRLGESSLKISQVVSFIEEIALKTNVLSINASVEAGRAGEYGQGFTIVAEQVGALAEQSAAATKEIANIVSAIQAETQEVNRAMESGTTQVVETTRLVESTKQSLGLVLEKSQEVNQLMESISQSTVSQASTSQTITNLMQKIAELSATTSQSSTKVAQSIGETAQVAQKLESTVAQFKVAESV